VPATEKSETPSVLQNELRGKSNKLVLYAFDLLYLNGYDMSKAPLFERKAALRTLIAKSDILFSDSFEVDGAEMFKSAYSMGLEGVASKVRGCALSFWPHQRLGQGHLPPARDAADCGIRHQGKQVRRHLSRPPARNWYTPVRSTTALTLHRPRICRRGSSR